MKIKTSLAIMLTSVCALALEVVLPDSPTTFERTAAEELVLHLKDVYGGDVSLISEKDAKGSIAIYIGDTALAKTNGIDCAKMGNEEWHLKSLDDKRLVAAGGSPRGVIYSAYELLERLYGVMWLDEHFTVFPKERLDKWPEIGVGGRPDFKIREIHANYAKDYMARWMYKVRNRVNLINEENVGGGSLKVLKRYGITKIYGRPRECHTYYAYTNDLPAEDDDCFSMNAKGQRVRSTSPSGPGQICFSNPKTLDRFEKKLREFIALDRQENPDNPPFVYEVSANDNKSECQCKGCRELVKKYGTYSGAVVYFTNALAERIEKDYPEIMLQMFAYHTATKPPKGITARSNVFVRLAQLSAEWGGHRDSMRSLSHPINMESLEEFNAWTKIATVSIWDYWITYCGASEGICYETISDNLKLYHSRGIENVFVEHEQPMIVPFHPLRNWLGHQLMNDSGKDIDALRDRFIAAYYGEKAAPFMTAILELMLSGQRQITKNLCKLSFSGRPDYSREYFASYDVLIEKALAVTDNPEFRKHIIMLRLQLGFAKLKALKSEASSDFKAFIAQMRGDYTMLVPELGGSSEMVNALAMYENIDGEIPMPAEIDGYKVVHQITWRERVDYVPVRRLFNDPDAAGGRTQKAEDQNSGYSGCSFGYYVPKTKKFVQQIDPLPIEKIAQDGKYHYYKIGKVTLDETGFFHAHRSWTDQWYTDHLFIPGGDNDYIAYISLKCTGPAYVKGSQDKTSAIWTDRVLLVREK